MPPFTFQSFEEIEAKEWASNTMKDILTEITPVTFEQVVSTDSSQNQSYLKRSLSFLESSLFGQRSKGGVKWSRRSHSTLLNNQLLYQSPFPCRLRNTWNNVDRTYTFNIFNSQKRTKREREGYSVWKNKTAEYSTHPPWSKSLDVKHRKNSVQLSKFIVNELLSTEETYLTHLLTIKNFYMDPLIVISMEKTSLIFAFIPEIIMLSNALYKHLHDTISNSLEDEKLSIGKLFCELEPYFEIYIAYAVNFSKSRKYIHKASSNIAYHQLIQDTLRKKDNNRMILSDYMIAPIQRITRYCLLLTDLSKHSPKTHPDYNYLCKALTSLSALAYAMNTVQ